MSEEAAAPPETQEPIRAEWRFTEAEIQEYWNVARGRNSGGMAPYESEWIVEIAVMGLAIAAQFVAYELGVIDDPRNPTVALLCLITVYVAYRVRERLLKSYWATYRTDSLSRQTGREHTFVMTETGIVYASQHERLSYDWPAVQQVTYSGGLMLFWVRERNAVPIPIRAIPEADRRRAYPMAKMRGAVSRATPS